jgi:hypothetical protein
MKVQQVTTCIRYWGLIRYDTVRPTLNSQHWIQT